MRRLRNGRRLRRTEDRKKRRGFAGKDRYVVNGRTCSFVPDIQKPIVAIVIVRASLERMHLPTKHLEWALYLLASCCMVGASPARRRPEKAASYDLPLTWSPFGFLGNVSIGTPPQLVTSFVDWTWINQYVFTTTCHGDPERTYDCFAKDQAIFNQSLSSSFRDQSALYPSRTWNPNHFFFYEDLTVDHASDIETVGPSSARITLQAADQQFDLSDAPYPFAGVYGLSPVFKTDNSRSSPASPPLSLLTHELLCRIHPIALLSSLV